MRRWQIYLHYTRQRRPIQLHVSLLFLLPLVQSQRLGTSSPVLTLHLVEPVILDPHPHHTVTTPIFTYPDPDHVYTVVLYSYVCTVTVSDCICMLPLVGEFTRVLGGWMIVSGTFGVDCNGTGTFIPGGYTQGVCTGSIKVRPPFVFLWCGACKH